MFWKDYHRKRLAKKDIPNLAMLDGDELREWFSPKDFSKAGRDEHNKKVAHLAKLLLNMVFQVQYL